MRRREPVRVGEALDQFFRERPEILKKIAEARLPEGRGSWGPRSQNIRSE